MTPGTDLESIGKVSVEELEQQNRELRQTQRSLTQARDRYAALYDFAPVAYVTLNTQSVIEEINRTATDIVGRPRAVLIGKPLHLLVATEDREALFKHLRRALRLREKVVDEIRLQCRDGWRDFSIESLVFDASEPGRQRLAVRSALIDVTERKHAARELAVAAKVLELTSDAVAITDALHQIDSVNPAFTILTGYSGAEMNGKNLKRLVAPQQNNSAFRKIGWAINRHGHWRGELWSRRKSGETWLASVTIHAVKPARGHAMYYIVAATDITVQKAVADHTHALAHFDYLTGLPNRVLLGDRLHQTLAHAERIGKLAAILFIDLDNFKDINDTLGHARGDKMLQAVAARLRGCLRRDDTVARLGGDEFVVVPQVMDTRAEAAEVAAAVLDALARPYSIDRHELHVTPSIGISLYPDDGSDAQTLLKHADIAMYQAKSAGRNHYQFFAKPMNARLVARAAMKNELHGALARGEFVLHYQPLFDVTTRQITGAEALLRWRHPTKGLLFPRRFMPLAEETGAIVDINRFVLIEACAAGRRWQAASRLAAMPVAVNLSAVQFRRQDFHETVADILKQTGLAPHYLELELTESVLMHNTSANMAMLKTLKAMGVRLSVENFGTGYSSFRYLEYFPIDTVKIDSSLVRDAASNSDHAAIAGGIIRTAKKRQLMVSAQGVETEKQFAFLSSMGCDRAQGFYLGKPCSAEAFVELFTN